MYKCDCCDEFTISRDELKADECVHDGWRICKACGIVREVQPILFDFFLKMIEWKIQKVIDKHEERYPSDY